MRKRRSKTNVKKAFAILLAIIMLVSIFPMTALAVGEVELDIFNTDETGCLLLNCECEICEYDVCECDICPCKACQCDICKAEDDPGDLYPIEVDNEPIGKDTNDEADTSDKDNNDELRSCDICGLGDCRCARIAMMMEKNDTMSAMSTGGGITVNLNNGSPIVTPAEAGKIENETHEGKPYRYLRVTAPNARTRVTISGVDNTGTLDSVAIFNSRDILIATGTQYSGAVMVIQSGSTITGGGGNPAPNVAEIAGLLNTTVAGTFGNISRGIYAMGTGTQERMTKGGNLTISGTFGTVGTLNSSRDINITSTGKIGSITRLDGPGISALRNINIRAGSEIGNINVPGGPGISTFNGNITIAGTVGTITSRNTGISVSPKRRININAPIRIEPATGGAFGGRLSIRIRPSSFAVWREGAEFKSGTTYEPSSSHTLVQIYQAPVRPKLTRALLTSSSAVELQWNTVPGEGVGYQVLRRVGTSGAFLQVPGASFLTGNTFTDNAPVKGVRNSYVIVAVVNSGHSNGGTPVYVESSPSSARNVTPPA